MKKRTMNVARFVVFFLLITQLQACQLFKKAQISNTQAPDPSFVEDDTGSSKTQVNIRIPLNSKIVFVNGQEVPLNSPPAYVDSNSITMVPLGLITEIIGAKVDWIAETKEIIITQDSKEIKLQINNYVALVNLKEQQLVSPPQIKEDRAFVPLKFIAQTLGFNSKWIAETKSINLTK
jgi:hypothetical protein